MIASRAFVRAVVRYRLLTVAFALIVAIGPLALAAAALRPAVASTAAWRPALLELAAVPVLGFAATVGLTLILELLFDVVRLRRIKRGALPIGTVPVRGARIGSSPLVETPTAIGYLHPAIVLPEGFRDRVDAGEWDAVVAHECAHLARCDDWAKAVQSAVLRSCWWIPGLWPLSRAIDLERELASDERAADRTGARRYAACLLRLATAEPAEALAPALWGRRPHVAIRVERLLCPPADPSPSLRAIALGAFTATALAAIGAAFLAVPGTGRPRVGTGAVAPIRVAATAVQHRRRNPLVPAREARRCETDDVVRRPRRGRVVGGDRLGAGWL